MSRMTYAGIVDPDGFIQRKVGVDIEVIPKILPPFRIDVVAISRSVKLNI